MLYLFILLIAAGIYLFFFHSFYKLVSIYELYKFIDYLDEAPEIYFSKKISKLKMVVFGNSVSNTTPES